MTEADGVIRILPQTELQPAFREVVDAVINALARRPGDTLYSILR